MAASTAFLVENLILTGSGGGGRVFQYVSTADARTTLEDTAALGSYFSSSFSAFSAGDRIWVGTSTNGWFPLNVIVASSSGVTVGTVITSTGAEL